MKKTKIQFLAQKIHDIIGNIEHIKQSIRFIMRNRKTKPTKNLHYKIQSHHLIQKKNNEHTMHKTKHSIKTQNVQYINKKSL